MHYDRLPKDAVPLFEDMPTLSDENIAELLQLLLGLVDAYESHYADPLRRWRETRYRELQEDFDDRQLNLTDAECLDDPF